MTKILISSLMSFIASSSLILASQAPRITDKDFLDEIFLNMEGSFSLTCNSKRIEADYIEEESISAYSQGNRSFNDNYLQPLLQGTFKPGTNERVNPTFATIHNPVGKLLKVSAENSGRDKFFSKLDSSHYGQMACKYSFQIPGTTTIVENQFPFGPFIFRDVPRQVSQPGKSFTFYLLFKPEDVASGSVISFNTSSPQSITPPVRQAIPPIVPRQPSFQPFVPLAPQHIIPPVRVPQPVLPPPAVQHVPIQAHPDKVIKGYVYKWNSVAGKYVPAGRVK